VLAGTVTSAVFNVELGAAGVGGETKVLFTPWLMGRSSPGAPAMTAAAVTSGLPGGLLDRPTAAASKVTAPHPHKNRGT